MFIAVSYNDFAGCGPAKSDHWISFWFRDKALLTGRLVNVLVALRAAKAAGQFIEVDTIDGKALGRLPCASREVGTLHRP